MLNISDVGKFYVRTKELPIFPETEGQIVMIKEVSHNGIRFNFTDDCRPIGSTYQLPPEANDNGWYDITQLILMANSTILPKYSDCVFNNDVAMNYRNFIDINIHPVDERSAEGMLCLLGNTNGKNLTFTKQAYYIVSSDENGYILAYSGFCQPLESWEKPKIQQRVLKLTGTNRKLFSARAVVEACNAAYAEDFELANKYAAEISDAVCASSAEAGVGKNIFNSGIARMSVV